MTDPLHHTCLSDGMLAEFFDPISGSNVRAEVEDHVDECVRCRQLLARIVLDGKASAPAAEGPPPPLAPGDRIGRHVVLGVAGAGAMGVVYAAYDEELDRRVAIKLLNATGAPGGDERRRVRVRREAQAMARVSHPNVVSVFEVGEHQGRVFLAMEFVAGTTLRKWQREPQRTVEEVIGAYLAAGEGLLAAHRSGLVHRDFKPDNVLIGSDGRPRVADFGLARVGPVATHASSPGDTSPLDIQLSVAGAILGTPAFMAPEQHRGEPADARSDQFSFCVALYDALYGAPPFAGTTIAELRESVNSGALRPAPASSQVPAPVDRALRRGLAVDPAQRFPSMAELLHGISLDRHRDPTAASPATQIFLLVGLLVLLGSTRLLAGFFFTERHPVEVLRFFQLGLVSFGVAAGLGLLLHRRLAWNTFHWNLLRLSIITAAQLALLRWVGLCAGMELRWILVFDLIAYAACTEIAAWCYLPWAWPSAALCLLTAIALVIWPRMPLLLAEQAYPVAAAWVFALWYRAARRRKSPTIAPRSEASTSATTMTA